MGIRNGIHAAVRAYTILFWQNLVTLVPLVRIVLISEEDGMSS